MTKLARYIVLGALFTVPFVVLYVSSGYFFPFITGKGFLFRILIEIAAGAYLVLALAEPRYRPRFSWMFLIYGALTLWMFIADLFALNAHKAFWSNYERMDGWVTLIHVFLFFVIAGAVLTADKLWRKWWLTFIGAAALVCGYALLQLTGDIRIHQSGVRLDATLGNSAYLAGYMLFALAVTLWQSIESKGWLRYILGALAAVEVLILFNTATRGAILALVGATILAALLWMLGAGKRGRTFALGALVGVLVLVGGFFLLRGTSVIENSPVLSRISSISLADGSTRFTLWGMAAEGVAKRPITGYGHEGFNYVFNTYYEPSLYAQEPWFDRAHNVFIDWLVWGGIPGFLLFVALFITAVLALYRSEVTRAERVLFTSALAAYAFQALFVFDNLFTYIPLAALFAMAHAASARPLKIMERVPVPSAAHLSTVFGPITLAATLAIVWLVNVPGMKGAHDLVYAISTLPGSPSANLTYFTNALADGSFATQEIREQLVSRSIQTVSDPTAPDQLKYAFVSLAATEMQKEIDRAPKDARLHMQKSLVLEAGGAYDEAVAEIDAAIALSPKKQGFYLQKANIYMNQQKYEEARAALRAAYELDTSFPELAAGAAAGDVLVGDFVGAQAFLLETFGTTTVASNALVRAYYETQHFDALVDVIRLQVAEAGNTGSARVRLAQALAVAGRNVEARAELAGIIRDDPSAAAQAQALLSQLPSN